MIGNNAFFGIPLPFFGFGCFILALVFLNVWPRAKAQKYARISWPAYVLHFFQALAWVLFGMAALTDVRSPLLAGLFLVLGVAAYIIFFAVFARA